MGLTARLGFRKRGYLPGPATVAVLYFIAVAAVHLVYVADWLSSPARPGEGAFRLGRYWERRNGDPEIQASLVGHPLLGQAAWESLDKLVRGGAAVPSQDVRLTAALGYAGLLVPAPLEKPDYALADRLFLELGSDERYRGLALLGRVHVCLSRSAPGTDCAPLVSEWLGTGNLDLHPGRGLEPLHRAVVESGYFPLAEKHPAEFLPIVALYASHARLSGPALVGLVKSLPRPLQVRAARRIYEASLADAWGIDPFRELRSALFSHARESARGGDRKWRELAAWAEIREAGPARESVYLALRPHLPVAFFSGESPSARSRGRDETIERLWLASEAYRRFRRRAEETALWRHLAAESGKPGAGGESAFPLLAAYLWDRSRDPRWTAAAIYLLFPLLLPLLLRYRRCWFFRAGAVYAAASAIVVGREAWHRIGAVRMAVQWQRAELYQQLTLGVVAALWIASAALVARLLARETGLSLRRVSLNAASRFSD